MSGAAPDAPLAARLGTGSAAVLGLARFLGGMLIPTNVRCQAHPGARQGLFLLLRVPLASP